ncbi:MAG: ATP-binding cassette domain-containing protein [Deinococcus sp.]|nr:ATP-binding cassette domain-containing protein [Deinococcus sp.]
MEVIELQGMSKTFGEVTALHDLNLNIRPGELTALLGPNGAGKITAISLMLGLAAPTQG